MSCPVYDTDSTLMHIEKAEVLRLRRIEAAAKVWEKLFVWTEPFEGYDEEKALHRALADGAGG